MKLSFIFVLFILLAGDYNTQYQICCFQGIILAVESKGGRGGRGGGRWGGGRGGVGVGGLEDWELIIVVVVVAFLFLMFFFCRCLCFRICSLEEERQEDVPGES